MKKYISIIILCLTFLSSVSCGKVDNSVLENEAPKKVIYSQPSIRMYESIDECIENADYIVTCTVTEIGDTFQYGGPKPEINQNSTTEEINDYIRSIRTPLVLEINDTLYSSKEIENNSLTVLLSKGVYNGYELKNDFPEYEVGHTYLLFISEAPDVTTNIINHQGSVELSTGTSRNSVSNTSLTPLFNERIFDDFTSISDICDKLY